MVCLKIILGYLLNYGGSIMSTATPIIIIIMEKVTNERKKRDTLMSCAQVKRFIQLLFKTFQPITVGAVFIDLNQSSQTSHRHDDLRTKHLFFILLKA